MKDECVFQVEIFDRDEIHFSSGFPCTISEVRPGIGSSCTRPMPGDVLLQVNNINVSRTQAKAVKKLIRFVKMKFFSKIINPLSFE